MKKFFLLLVLGAVGYAAYKQVEQQKLEAELWTEATEIKTVAPVDLR